MFIAPEVIENNQFDIFSIMLTILLMVILFIILSSKNNNNDPLIMSLVGSTVVYYLIRIIFLMLFPDSYTYFKFFDININDFNKTTLYLIIATVIIFLGVKYQQNRYRKYCNYAFSLPKYLTLRNTVTLALILIAIYYYSFASLGLGRRSQNINIPGWVYYFNNFQAMLSIAILVYLTKKHTNMRTKYSYYLFGVILIYFIVRTSAGSRYSIIYLLQTLIFINILHKGDFFIRIRHILFIVLGMLGGIIIFPLATFFRNAIWASSAFVGATISVDDILSLLSYYRFTISPELLYTISGRMSQFDRLLNIVAEKGYNIKQYFNIPLGIKSTINNLFPGELFPGADLMTKKYTVVFYGWKEDFALDHYQTETLTAIGEYYIYFGYFGGIVASGLIASVLAYIFYKTRSSGSSYNTIYQYLALGLFNGWLISFGFDFQIITFYRLVLCLVLYFIILKSVNMLFSKRKAAPFTEEFSVTELDSSNC